jgi:mannosyltransferase
VTSNQLSYRPDTGRSAGAGAAGQDVRAAPGRLVPVLPALVAFGFGLWRLTGPGMWRDEAATYSTARRSVPQIWHLTSQVDAVHFLYYFLIHLDFAVFGASTVTLRAPSVLAGAGTAALLAAVGNRLAGPRAGLLAGLFWAVLPQTSRQMQEGRSTSLVMLCVLAAAYFLVREMWAWAAVAVALAGALNVLSSLVLAAFAVTALLWRWQGAIGGRALVRAASAGAAGFLAGAVPAGLRGRGQRGVLGWIPEPGRQTWHELSGAMCGGHRLVVPVLAVAAFGCCRAALGDGRRLVSLAVPLLVLPTALLVGYSLVGTPSYVMRYVFYTFAGLAWLVGLGLDGLLRYADRGLRRLRPLPAGASSLAVGLLAVALVCRLGWPEQNLIRTVDGHGDPLERIARVVGDGSRLGDAVLYLGADRRYAALAYPADFAHTADVMLTGPVAESASLYGAQYPVQDLTARLAGHDRVWVVWSRWKWHRDATFQELRQDGYRQVSDWRLTPGMDVLLFARLGADPDIHGRFHGR